MAKKHSGSSARDARAKKNAKTIPDHEIDFSDIPELSDAQLKGMKRLGRPLLGKAPRKMIAVRIDQEVLEQLKKEAERAGKGYQSLINEILTKHTTTKKKAA